MRTNEACPFCNHSLQPKEPRLWPLIVGYAFGFGTGIICGIGLVLSVFSTGLPPWAN